MLNLPTLGKHYLNFLADHVAIKSGVRSGWALLVVHQKLGKLEGFIVRGTESSVEKSASKGLFI